MGAYLRFVRLLAPWLLNVPMAHAELAARGPHAVIGQAESIMGRAACTKCRGMNPLLGACTALKAVRTAEKLSSLPRHRLARPVHTRGGPVRRVLRHRPRPQKVRRF